MLRHETMVNDHAAFDQTSRIFLSGLKTSSAVRGYHRINILRLWYIDQLDDTLPSAHSQHEYDEAGI